MKARQIVGLIFLACTLLLTSFGTFCLVILFSSLTILFMGGILISPFIFFFSDDDEEAIDAIKMLPWALAGAIICGLSAAMFIAISYHVYGVFH